MEVLSINQLFDLRRTLAADYLRTFDRPWEAVPGIGGLIAALGPTLDRSDYQQVKESVWVHRTAVVAPTAFLGQNTIVGPGTQVRHCAFVRENALVGAGCVVGNSTELKNVILFDAVETPHYNYVGDSILGHHAHMGAGSITSNVKSDYSDVTIRDGAQLWHTSLMKLGALLGDGVEVGCNSVLNPGTVIGRGSRVYPLSSIRGVVPPGCIVKSGGVIVKME